MTMTHLMRRFLQADYPTAVGGFGPYLRDETGRRYLDGSSGAGVSSLGYGNKSVIEAICRQAQDLAYCYNAYFTTKPAEDLAEKISTLAPGNLNWFFPGSGGSESIDGAIKLARQYWLEMGEMKKLKIISRRQSYHGCTIGSLGISHNQMRRQPFAELLMDPIFISPCYAYRDQQECESAEDYCRRLIDELERTIEEAGAENISACFMEPVVAATAGCVPPVTGYFEEVRRICTDNSILLILDEIFTGIGRTGAWFASEHEEVVPDIAVLGKGLAAGYQPISALLVSDTIIDVISERRGYFMHGHTYGGHATACAAALAVLGEIESNDLLSNVNERSEQLFEALHSAFEQHPHVGDIRGRGLMIGLELVEDRVTKKPFPSEKFYWFNIARKALEHGLICYPMPGTIDGVTGEHILLAPPLIIEPDHVDELTEKLVLAVDEALEMPPPALG